MKICVVVTARPSYSRVRSLLRALQQRPDVELQLVVCASALLERYGNVSQIIEQEFPIAARIYSVYEGENPETTARSTAALLNELSCLFRATAPSVVVVHADRHEVLAAAQAASYQGIAVAHLQGGEHTGSIDQKVRHAITQLADLHLVSTPQAAAQVLVARWPHKPQVHVCGCPSVDLCVGLEQDPPVTLQELGGAGVPVALDKPFVVVLQHPTTESWEQAHDEMDTTLMACAQVGLPTVCFWPGNEAGADGASKAIRQRQRNLHTVRNLPPRRFLRLLCQAASLVGNSSVGLREAAYLGRPVVNIGERQRHRERDLHVVDVPHDVAAIAAAIEQQIAHGPYPRSLLYGAGDSGEKMAGVICETVKQNWSIRENRDRTGTLLDLGV